jgi:hypothetical protein
MDAQDIDRRNIDDLRARVETLEKRERGPLSKIAHAGIVIGCLGGLLGGASTLSVLWKQVTARPDIHMFTNDSVDLFWKPEERSLSLSGGISLLNMGEVAGVVTAAHAQLESEVLIAPEYLEDVTVKENNGAVGLPLTIGAAGSRDVQFQIASTISSTQEPDFPKEGLYKLVLQLVTPLGDGTRTGNGGGTKKEDVYCFYLASSLVKDLREIGHGKVGNNDPRCIRN